MPVSLFVSAEMIRHLVRRAFELPPHVATAKAVRLAGRFARERVRRVEDRLRPSYGGGIGPLLPMPVPHNPAAIDEAGRKTLMACGEMYMAHRFDILGSGWVDVGYGVEAEGIEGVKYAPDADAQRVAQTGDPTALVARANRVEAARIFGLITSADYRPIDWQRDMRSGFRWSAATPANALRIGLDRGADIKMPWELSRMQHLPQLALLASLAAAGQPGARPADACVAEIRNQMLDFVASNPPRYGACWGCPMDVGIRVANWVLTLGLLDGAGLSLDEPCRAILARSIYDHAGHIAANLEWAESGRSNHYLADLVGLLFAAAILPRQAETRSWVNFAAREIVAETGLQFHADGGNYEGSTSYHRLSGELALFGTALAAGLARREPALFTAFDDAVMTRLKAPTPPLEPSINMLLRGLCPRLEAILAFSEAIRRPDGRMIQVGDTDSGRLFKLLPPPAAGPQADATAPREDHLRIDDLAGGIGALLGRETDGAGSLAGSVVRALSHGWEDFGDRGAAAGIAVDLPCEPLDDIERRIMTLPAAARRRHVFALSRQDADGRRVARLAAFPEFGLYVLSAAGIYLAFRCAPHGRRDAPTSHLHDDNLSIELFTGTDSVVSDPGTYVYTSLPEWRNAYRRAEAHFAPRATEWEAVAYTDYLFELRPLATARCLHASGSGLAGVLDGPGRRVYRLVRIDGDAVTVLDAAEHGTLRALPDPVMRCDGYGRKTAHPAYLVQAMGRPNMPASGGR